MSDFTSSFWNVYIAVITVAAIIACGVLLQSMSRRKIATDPDQTGHVWDEDLVENNNPLPRWWVWLFWITIFFSVGYLVVYPGLGSYSGTLKWTSTGAYQAETDKAEKDLAPMYAQFTGTPVEKLAADPAAQAIGQRLFLNHCAQCHASDGAGSRGFPNLTDKDWLYGGDPETIKKTILEGRNGVMIPFGSVLNGEQIKDVSHYVRSLSGLTVDSLRVARGKEVFAANCVACHGADGKGNPALGSPNLTDNTWLYGSAEPVIIETVTKGRNNAMPAHRDFLGEARVHVLTSYVFGLSRPETRK